MSGKLSLVPTPIGNLQDMTFRAIECLKSVDGILAEDTRTSGNLLKHFEIENKLISHHKFNEHKTSESLTQQMLSGAHFALISDAGTPAISDPGYLLVKHCIDAGIEVECLPGATAIIPALAVSGLPNDRFVFEGFLPIKKGRQTRLNDLSEETRTMVFYESPHKLLKTLSQFVTNFGPKRSISVSRELTKIYEETIRGTVKEVLEHYTEKPPKGEIVIVVSGKK
jgi:16S rRNA (cytidine1402-2'-O)-methyltransferase